MTPKRDGDRAATRSTVHDLEFLGRKVTAEAKLEAALNGLGAGLLYGEWDATFTSEAAIVLIDAALRDLAA